MVTLKTIDKKLNPTINSKTKCFNSMLDYETGHKCLKQCELCKGLQQLEES